MKHKYSKLTATQKDRIIHLAWQDRCSFERIEEIFGYSEDHVISIMRTNLKPASFRRWRKRVSGRVTKHRKKFKHEPSFKGSFE